MEVAVSKFPVGSSAKMMEGRLTRARATATPLALPTTQFIGAMAHAVCQADLGEYFLGSFFSAFTVQAGIDQWQSHVFKRCIPRQQIECLKDKPNFHDCEFPPTDLH